MFNKILTKVKTIVLPCITLAASTIFFFSIGLYFGVNKKSDFILFTITTLSTIGTILQISWYGLLPRITSSKNEKFIAFIITNGFLYCITFNLVPFLFIPVDFFKNIFLSGCFYSLIFQLHQYIKNTFVYLGNLKAFYIFDAAGYSLTLLTMLVLHDKITSFTASEFFLLLSLSWLIILVSEIIFLKKYISHRVSLTLFILCIIPTWKTRVANSGFIIKDLLTAYILNNLVPSGGLTIYSYASKIANAVFQLFSQYKVNSWVGYVRVSGLKEIKLNDIKRVSLLSSLDYCCFLLLACVTIYLMISTVNIKVDIKWSLISVFSSGFLYLIQSIEQPFSRYIYMSKGFSDIAYADGLNFILYFIFLVIGYYDGSIYYVLFGIIIAQLSSFFSYYHSCKRLFK